MHPPCLRPTLWAGRAPASTPWPHPTSKPSSTQAVSDSGPCCPKAEPAALSSSTSQLQHHEHQAGLEDTVRGPELGSGPSGGPRVQLQRDTWCQPRALTYGTLCPHGVGRIGRRWVPPASVVSVPRGLVDWEPDMPSGLRGGAIPPGRHGPVAPPADHAGKPRSQRMPGPRKGLSPTDTPTHKSKERGTK